MKDGGLIWVRLFPVFAELNIIILFITEMYILLQLSHSMTIKSCKFYLKRLDYEIKLLCEFSIVTWRLLMKAFMVHFGFTDETLKFFGQLKYLFCSIKIQTSAINNCWIHYQWWRCGIKIIYIKVVKRSHNLLKTFHKQ